MRTEQFEQVIERQFDRCRELLVTKGKEYTPYRDVLEVFNKASELSGEGGRKASLFGFMLKHVVSISDMCHSDTVYDLDRWNEKITDTINYLLLLKAMVEEDEIFRNDPRWGNEDGATMHGFEWVPDKPSYASWDEMAEAVEEDTNGSCCLDCNECAYSGCDGSEDALNNCQNECNGCSHHTCEKERPHEFECDYECSTCGYKTCTNDICYNCMIDCNDCGFMNCSLKENKCDGMCYYCKNTGCHLHPSKKYKEPRDCRLCEYAIWSLDSDKEMDIPFCFKKESDGCSGYAWTPYWKEENRAEEEVTQEDWEDFWREPENI